MTYSLLHNKIIALSKLTACTDDNVNGNKCLDLSSKKGGDNIKGINGKYLLNMGLLYFKLILQQLNKNNYSNN